MSCTKALVCQLVPVVLFQLLVPIVTKAQEESVTIVDAPTTTPNNTNTGDSEGGSSNTAAVVIAIIVTVLVLVAIVVLVFFIRRRRQSVTLEKEKKMQMQMSSARNAGVYQDLTVSVPAEEKPPASPEHEKLNAAEEA